MTSQVVSANDVPNAAAGSFGSTDHCVRKTISANDDADADAVEGAGRAVPVSTSLEDGLHLALLGMATSVDVPGRFWVAVMPTAGGVPWTIVISTDVDALLAFCGWPSTAALATAAVHVYTPADNMRAGIFRTPVLPRVAWVFSISSVWLPQ